MLPQATRKASQLATFVLLGVLALHGLREQGIDVAALPLDSLILEDLRMQLVGREVRLIQILNVLPGAQALLLLPVGEHGAPLFVRSGGAGLALDLAGQEAGDVAQGQVLPNLKVLV